MSSDRLVAFSRPEVPTRREVVAEPRRYAARLCRALEHLDLAAVESLAARVLATVVRGGAVHLAGNGGSASTASHYACDLKLVFRGRGLRPAVHNFAESQAVLTALANDHGYDDVFRHQLVLEAAAGDLLVAISASGDSENVVRAARAAREMGVAVAAITGFDGGRLRPLGHVSIHIEESHYGVIEDVQLAVGHMLSQAVAGLLDHRAAIEEVVSS
ncbi:MAG: SIS domain-containing protein [Acidobacteria bacterium]|nr:SIS domain-containing protein [Acidobacteriota bacterium]